MSDLELALQAIAEASKQLNIANKMLALHNLNRTSLKAGDINKGVAHLRNTVINASNTLWFSANCTVESLQAFVSSTDKDEEVPTSTTK